jgi:23S rRNA (adenine2503-C2)-methyltransferase
MPQPLNILEQSRFFGLTARETDALLTSWGWPAYRAGQVREWVYGKRLHDPAAMSNLPADARSELRKRVSFLSGELVTDQRSSDGTRKLLLAWDNGKANAETVMIPDGTRRTACVSSQVGCPVGCKFCASGINGVKGNLTAAQIVEQVVWLNLGSDERTERRSDGGQRWSGVSPAPGE